MNLDEFNKLFINKLAHDPIEIKCDNCKELQKPLKTRAKQTILKRGKYLCPKCGQKERHAKTLMTEKTKLKISEGVKNFYDKKDETKPSFQEWLKNLN